MTLALELADIARIAFSVGLWTIFVMGLGYVVGRQSRSKRKYD